MHIWQQLSQAKKPFFILAPMEDVTDTVFRRVVAQAGRPDLFFTEFTSSEGAQSIGQGKVIYRFQYTEEERPLIAQIWGITPEDHFKTAQMVVELGFDGLDINMGCPVKKIVKKGGCSGLIKNPSLAKEIVDATREGLAGKIPLSIKTRIGFDSIATEEWCGFLLEQCQPDALTVHGRTSKQMSKAANNWDEIGKVVSLKEQHAPETVVIGNGDILSYQQGLDLAEKHKLDGVMIGRGIFHNPWFFDPMIDPEQKTIKDKIELLKLHINLFRESWEGKKNYHILKRFYKVYIHSFEGAVQLRGQLMDTEDYDLALDILESYPLVS